LAIVADEQIILEAAVEIPPAVEEALFYLLAVHYFLPLSGGSVFRCGGIVSLICV
jgi:hypothetical protein